MNQIIDYSERKVVIITDPHIKETVDYRVYKEAMTLDNNIDKDDPL